MHARGTPNTGIVYVSFGDLYRELATLSISSLRRFGYCGPIRILSDRQNWDIDHLDCELLDVPSAGEGFGSRFYKTRVNEYGFDTTLFLDADTLVCAPIGHVWHELRFAEICMSLDYHPDVRDLITRSNKGRDRRQVEYDYMRQLGLIDRPFHSSGVMLFHRSSAIDELFRNWHDEWRIFQDEDQLALVRAIARTGSCVHALAPRWNMRLTRYTGVAHAQRSGVRILHLRPGNEPLLPAILAEYASSGFLRSDGLGRH
jgi:hypothetical protein